MRLPRWLRRQPRPVFEPIRTPFTDPEPLGDEVVRHLYATLSNAPPADVRVSRWVMNMEWLNEIRRSAAALDGAFYLPMHSLELGCVEYLLGIPLEVRDDGGVPHLEPYG